MAADERFPLPLETAWVGAAAPDDRRSRCVKDQASRMAVRGASTAGVPSTTPTVRGAGSPSEPSLQGAVGATPASARPRSSTGSGGRRCRAGPRRAAAPCRARAASGAACARRRELALDEERARRRPRGRRDLVAPRRRDAVDVPAGVHPGQADDRGAAVPRLLLRPRVAVLPDQVRRFRAGPGPGPQDARAELLQDLAHHEPAVHAVAEADVDEHAADRWPVLGLERERLIFFVALCCGALSDERPRAVTASALARRFWSRLPQRWSTTCH